MGKEEMSVVEALGLGGSDALEESEMDLEVVDLMDVYREASTWLDEIDEHIDEYMLEYDALKEKDRQKLESIIDMKLYILTSMARFFNPMTSFGKKKLREAVEWREDFEALYGPLLTRITGDNAGLFRSVLNEDLMEDIATSRRQALGALRTRNKTIYGAAAIAWHIDEVPGEELGVLRIDWLYVNEDFRGRSLSNYLLGELVALCNEAGIEHISVDISANNESKQYLARIFGLWQFSFDAGADPDIYIPTGDVTDLEMIEEYSRGVKPLSTMEISKADRMVTEFLQKTGYSGYLTYQTLPGNYIDRELSCFMGKPGKCTGLLLAHRAPLGMLRVEYLDSLPGHYEYVPAMVSAFIKNAKDRYEDNSLIYMTPEFPRLQKFINMICPKQVGQDLIEGLLSKPDSDMDEEVVKEMETVF